MNKRLAIIYVLWMIPVLSAFAQQNPGDTVLTGATIEVIQSYKPEARQLPRPIPVPDLPRQDTTVPKLYYTVPQQSLSYAYAALPLRPLMLVKDTVTRRFPGYIKIGGGNLSTFYLDAGSAHLKGKDFHTAIHLQHLSQHGSIRNQQTAFSRLETTGNYRSGNHTLSASLKGFQNRYFRYGGDIDPFNPVNNPALTYGGVQAAFSIRNNDPVSGISYTPAVKASFYGNDFNADETSFLFDLPASKQLNEQFTAGIGISGAITSNSLHAIRFSNNIIQFNPRVNYRNGDMSGHIGLSPAWGQNGKTYLLPDIGFSWNISGSKTVLTALWHSLVRRNTYQELTAVNPFLAAGYTTRQTRRDELSAGIRTSLGKHLGLSVKVGHLTFDNMPLYLNDTGNRKSFYLAYAGVVNAWTFESSLRYQVATVFSAGVTAVIYNYYRHSGHNRVWHEPTVRITGDVRYQPFEVLSVTGYLRLMDGLYALSPAQEAISLSTILDAGCGVEYQFISRLSAFVQVNNLFHNSFQRWYGYDAYGINIFGGLQFRF